MPVAGGSSLEGEIIITGVTVTPRFTPVIVITGVNLLLINLLVLHDLRGPIYQEGHALCMLVSDQACVYV